MAAVAVAPVLWAEEGTDEMPPTALIISVAEQKLALLKEGGLVKKYPISTSKFGLGDAINSYKTPLGRLRVCDKVGGHLAMGAVLKSRNATGEILPVNAPGRDPIVTRILWLDGLDSGNANARSRGIYIHGTVEESRLGQPVSYGCIRLRSRDVVEVFDEVAIGTPVLIISERFPRFRKPESKPEMLVASADAVSVKSTGPHGQVTVKTVRRVTFAPDEKPEPAVAKVAEATKPTVKVPTLVASNTKTPEKAVPVAKAVPAPEPVVEEAGPTIIFSRAQQTAATSPQAEPTIVFKLKTSILTAGIEQETSPKREAAPQPAPQTDAPRSVVLAVVTAFDFLNSGAEARARMPLDLLSAALLDPPSEDVRLAFRTTSLPRKL